MTKIALTHGYCEYQSYTRLYTHPPVPPHHLLQLSAYLTANKFTNNVIDITLHDPSLAIKQLEEEVPAYCFIEVVGTTLHTTLAMVQSIRRSEALKNVRIIAGGPGIALINQKKTFLEAGTDVVLLGEVQTTLTALLFTMDIPMNPFLDHIPGIAYINGHGDITETIPEEADQLQLKQCAPDWEKVDLSKYRDYGKQYDGYSVAKVAVSRILPSFSEDLQFYKSPDELVDEMNRLVYHDHFDRVIIEGDILRYPKWFVDFTDRCQIEDKLRYECYIQPGAADPEQLNILKLTGCVRLWVNVDTTSLDELFSTLPALTNNAWETEMQVGINVTLSEEDMSTASLKEVVLLLQKVMPDYLVVAFNIPHAKDHKQWSKVCFKAEKWLLKELEWHSICERKAWIWPASWIKGLGLLWQRVNVRQLDK